MRNYATNNIAGNSKHLRIVWNTPPIKLVQ